MVRDINPALTGMKHSYPSEITRIGDILFFRAFDPDHCDELWKSDGTEAGTMLVKDIDTVACSYPHHLTKLEGKLLFEASTVHEAAGGLWVSDGSTEGTRRVEQINPWCNLTRSKHAVINGVLFFPAASGTTDCELWRSDGTLTGTRLVKDIDPGPSALSFFEWSEMALVDGILILSVYHTGFGDELWKSDGSGAGTVLIKDIRPGVGSSYPSGLFGYNQWLYFNAAELHPEFKLWKSDGTLDGTQMVGDREAVSPIHQDGLHYSAYDDGIYGMELWKSDGTVEGLVMVKDINPGPASSMPNTPVSIEGKLLDGVLTFVANDGNHGFELWKIDGTLEGTVMVADINPGTDPSHPGRFTYSSGKLFFSADDGSHGVELWALDITRRASLPLIFR